MRFTARVTGFDGATWAIDLPQLGAGVGTTARKLTEVERQARDFICIHQDLRPSEVEVDIVVEDFRDGQKVQSRSTRLQSARRKIEAAKAELEDATYEFVRELGRHGLPQQDIATLAGISRPRVGQILASPTKKHLQPD